MHGFGTGLFRHGEKCAGKPLRISEIRLELVFRGLHEKSAHNRNKISTLRPELVFCEVPGKFVQWWRGADRDPGAGLVAVAARDAVGYGVVGITGAPTGLGFLAPGLLAVYLAASVLAVTDSVIRLEPPAADSAGPLPGIGHAGSSSSARVGQFW
jgi:hypothetical protein